ncbi:hypothetical protein BKA63DRAFT_16522 [Paraphoma chrysanthemicola]|nr:hypothetical protein BKA63DRAFT_16522 [Paraphoma chrysanthemicola]
MSKVQSRRRYPSNIVVGVSPFVKDFDDAAGSVEPYGSLCEAHPCEVRRRHHGSHQYHPTQEHQLTKIPLAVGRCRSELHGGLKRYRSSSLSAWPGVHMTLEGTGIADSRAEYGLFARYKAHAADASYAAACLTESKATMLRDQPANTAICREVLAKAIGSLVCMTARMYLEYCQNCSWLHKFDRAWFSRDKRSSKGIKRALRWCIWLQVLNV